MSAKKDAIIVGGEPRIDFLPPEIKQKKEARRALRGLVAIVLLALGACIIAYAGVTTMAVASQVNLAAEQQRTQQLLKDQGEYSEARQAAGAVDSVKNAVIVGSAHEILWLEYIIGLEGTMPAGTVITDLAIDSQTALEGSQAATIPLDQERIAILTISAQVQSQADAAQWLENLVSIRGYAGAVVSDIKLVDGGFEVNLVLAVNAGALEKRFIETPEAETTEEAPADADATEGED